VTTLVVTGSPGAGVGIAAAALALGLADAGRATLLISLSPPAALGALLGAEVGGEPLGVAPRLDALALDPSADLDGFWEAGRAKMPAQLARLGGDELPLLPGMGALFGLRRLRELAPRYERVVVDAGPHDTLVQVLNLPDIMRWGVRLLIGLDRGPGKSTASQARALLPTTFLPLEMTDRAQQLRVEAEALRDELIGAARAVYVLRPDGPALAEARMAVPAIQLHGMPVAALLAGPLLPGVPDERQERLLADAAAVWSARPLLRLLLPAADGVEGLRGAGGGLAALDDLRPEPPLADSHAGEPALVIDLPGLPQGALKLTLSGDDLIVRVGPYRRHVLLPERLRGITAIRATREGSRLVVRRRA
jgi:arsenite/tail-anchored protein-transporting ATPase